MNIEFISQLMSMPSEYTPSRRDSEGVGNLHELASPKELRKALECPICNEVPLAPIYTCSLGHTICGKCREEHKCGICGEDLSNNRNAAVELIVAKSSFWCKYFDDGCQRVIKGSEYRSHVEECDYRYIVCDMGENKRCHRKPIRYREYFEHLKSEHLIEGYSMEDERILTMSEYSNDLRTDGPWPIFYLSYDQDVFLRHMKIERSIVYLWFTLIGSQHTASRYLIKVTIYMKHDENSRIEWTIPLMSIRSTETEIESSFRIAIPSKQLEKFCSRRKHPHGEIFSYVLDLEYEIITI